MNDYMSEELLHISNELVADVIEIVRTARDKAYTAVNIAQVEANWLIGKELL